MRLSRRFSSQFLSLPPHRPPNDHDRVPTREATRRRTHFLARAAILHIQRHRNSDAPCRSRGHIERETCTRIRGVSGHVVVKSNSPAVLSAGDTKQRLPEWMGRPGRPSSKLRYLSARWKRSALSLGSRREFRIWESRSPRLHRRDPRGRARARASSPRPLL